MSVLKSDDFIADVLCRETPTCPKRLSGESKQTLCLVPECTCWSMLFHWGLASWTCNFSKLHISTSGIWRMSTYISGIRKKDYLRNRRFMVNIIASGVGPVIS